MTSELPAIFSTPMVKGLIQGRKTMTRRLAWKGAARSSPWRQLKPGDALWVRESWRVGKQYDDVVSRDLVPRSMTIVYEAGGSMGNDAGEWVGSEWPGDIPKVIPWIGRGRPPIHMPRWCSRILLAVTEIHIERLQDITAADAVAEGVVYETADPGFYYVPYIEPHSITAVGIEEREGPPSHAVRCFAKLWDHIHGPRSWDANPEVAVVSFEMHVKANVAPMAFIDASIGGPPSRPGA